MEAIKQKAKKRKGGPYRRTCPMCRKGELAPLAARNKEGATRALKGYYYCVDCDVIFKEEYKPVSVK